MLRPDIEQRLRDIHAQADVLTYLFARAMLGERLDWRSCQAASLRISTTLYELGAMQSDILDYELRSAAYEDKANDKS